MSNPERLRQLELAVVLLASSFLDYTKHNTEEVRQFLLMSYGEWNMGIEPETFDEWLIMITTKQQDTNNATVEMPKLPA